MKTQKMTQSQFEKHFQKQARAYAKNMCIFCKHNESCTLPLHGNFRMGGQMCPRAEYPDDDLLMMRVLEYFYGPAIRANLQEKVRSLINE